MPEWRPRYPKALDPFFSQLFVHIVTVKSQKLMFKPTDLSRSEALHRGLSFAKGWLPSPNREDGEDQTHAQGKDYLLHH